MRPNDPADIVIGQNDLARVLINAPQNNAEVPTDSGLFRPSGLIVDSNGDLFVADSGNSRVLRFPSPFEQRLAPGERHRANLVIGQRNASTRVTDASRSTMFYPFGLALTVEGHLVVSDAAHNRVLFFRRPTGGDFTTGMAAEKVVGQPDFFTVTRSAQSNPAPNRMFSPRHIALDTDDRLYVTDSGNSRVLIFDRITTAAIDPPTAFIITGLTSAQGIYVSPLTGEIWIANTRASRAQRFPRFERLTLGARSDFEVASSTPLALAQDSTGNLYIAEAINRVSIYFNGLEIQVAGSYADPPLSPGGIGIVYPKRTGRDFTSETVSLSSLPMPYELADIQVLLNDRPLPLYYVSPRQVSYYLPFDLPSSGTGELQVVRKSVGEILSAGTVNLAQVSPALFVQGGFDQGQVAAINQDGTINSANNPIPRGQILTLYATGLGNVANPPAEGTAPSGPVPAAELLRVLINTGFVDQEVFNTSDSLPGLLVCTRSTSRFLISRCRTMRTQSTWCCRSEVKTAT